MDVSPYACDGSLGDEMMSAVKIPPQNWSAVATKAKTLMVSIGGRGLVYGNLGGCWDNGTGCGRPSPMAQLGKVPEAVDILSVDL
eukprot:COSAG02_NODE_343_length_24147_cov_30.662051_17_plen_85_part_00